MAGGLAGGILLVAMSGLYGCGGDDGGGGGIDPLPCAITNVSTGAQTSWLVGVPNTIANLRWDHQGTATAVKIELLKAGLVVSTVAASTANDGFYAWTPSTDGQPNGNDFGLRVSALGETGCSGEKNGLTLTNVAGCSFTWTTAGLDTLNAGDAMSLTWTSASTSGTVDIELWEDAVELKLVGVIAAGIPDNGQYEWDPVDSFNAGTKDRYKLRLSESNVPGCEAYSSEFRLVDNVLCGCAVTGFSADSVWSLGQVMHLDLSQTNGSGFVNLRLLTGALPVAGGIIANNVPVSQVFDWTVSDFGYTGADRTKFHIRATDAADGYCVGVSDVFRIQ